jgi:hypothetical protein
MPPPQSPAHARFISNAPHHSSCGMTVFAFFTGFKLQNYFEKMNEQP